MDIARVSSPALPKIEEFEVDSSKMMVIIGKGGATIKEIIEKYSVNIDLDRDNGIVKVSGENSSKISEDYFQNLWEEETWVHDKLEISKPTAPVKPVTVYNDTDSCHISFEEIIKNTDWKKDPKDFINFTV